MPKNAKKMKRLFQSAAIVAPFATLVAIACDDDSKTTLRDTISATDFEISGSNGAGVAKLKDSKNLNSQLEVRYYIGATQPVLDSSYKSMLLTGLKNSDVVYAKLFVKTSASDKYFINSNAVKISIFGLGKTLLNDTIAPSDFTTQGEQTKGVIWMNDTKVLAPQLEVRYFVGLEMPLDDASYEKFAPQTLKNGDTIHVKLFVTKDYENSYTIRNTIAKVEVTNLEKMALVESLLVEDFQVEGVDGHAKLMLKSTANFHQALEIRYFIGTNETSDLTLYQIEAPQNLTNWQRVWIRLFVKASQSEDYQIASEAITILVANLQTEIFATLEASQFQVSGYNGQGILFFKDQELTNELEVRYFKGSSAPSDLNQYEVAAPSSLSNDEIVWAKFFVKESFKNQYFVNSEPIKLVVSDLQTLLNSPITSDSFEFIGTSTNGQVRLKASVVLGSQLEIRYYQGAKQVLEDDDFSASLPNTLANGQTIYAKAFVLNAYKDVYDIEDKVVKLVVGGLEKRAILVELKRDDFAITGFSTHGEITLLKVNLDEKLVVKYFKGLEVPTEDNLYLETLPSNLKNGDKIWIKVFVKPLFTNDFENIESPLAIEISGLKVLLTANVLARDFNVIGLEGSGTIVPNVSTVDWHESLEVRYFVGQTSPSSDASFSQQIPSNLSNNDVVWVKIFVKENQMDAFEVNFMPIKIEVQGLKTALRVDIAESDFELVKTNGQWTIKPTSQLVSNLPMQFEIRYFQGANEPTLLSDYVPTLNNLDAQGSVWARAFIKDAYASTYIVETTAIMIDFQNINHIFTERIAFNNFQLSSQNVNQATLVPITPYSPELDVQYAIGDNRPASSHFSITPPVLKNDDILWMKLVVKPSFPKYLIAENLFKVPTPIKWLNKISLVASITSDDLTFGGANSQGEVNVIKELPPMVEARFFVGISQPTQDSFYQAKIFNLSQGDKVWAKLFVKPEFASNYDLENPTTISKEVGLDSKLLVDHLRVIDIEAISLNNVNLVRIRDSVPLSSNLEVRFAVSDQSPLDASYTTTLGNLKNGDQVWAKLFVRPEAMGYSIQASAKNFRVYFDLQTNPFENDSDAEANLGDIILANEISKIPARTFINKILAESFILPAGVTEIGEFAFKADLSRASNFFKYNNVLKTIGGTAFAAPLSGNPALPSNFALPPNLREIPFQAFGGRVLPNDFRLPNTVEKIALAAFTSATLNQGFEIPKSVKIVESDAFASAILGNNSYWFDENHLRLADQNNPIPGAYVGLA